MKNKYYLIIAILILIASGFLLFKGEILNKLFTSHPAPSLNLDQEGQKFQTLWQQDIDNMHKEGIMPPSLNQVKSIRFIIKSEAFDKWKQHLITPLSTNPMGTKHLEILVHNWEDKDHSAIMIQYSLFDIKSTRLEWERARNIYLKSP